MGVVWGPGRSGGQLEVRWGHSTLKYSRHGEGWTVPARCVTVLVGSLQAVRRITVGQWGGEGFTMDDGRCRRAREGGPGADISRPWRHSIRRMSSMRGGGRARGSLGSVHGPRSTTILYCCCVHPVTGACPPVAIEGSQA
jgi:hypothetical protein